MIRFVPPRAARLLAAVALFAAALAGGGCATVRPHQREHLSDRIMALDAHARDAVRRMKALEAREGSTGGVGGAGGGCACN